MNNAMTTYKETQVIVGIRNEDIAARINNKYVCKLNYKANQ
jgi:hypothetical protein